MRSYKVARPSTAFSRGPSRQRRPRQRANQHLKWIRTLPCVICGKRGHIHAAHLRAASLQYGKLAIGIAEKPDDCWTTPLCVEHHIFGEVGPASGAGTRLLEAPRHKPIRLRARTVASF